jgi:transposase
MQITVTRVVEAVNPTQKKLDQLYKIARRYADVRNEVWRRYGSVSSLRKIDHPREVRDEWIETGKGSQFGLQARGWKMALDEAFGILRSLWSNAKTKVRQRLARRKDFSDPEKHYGFYLLKVDELLHKVLVGEKFDLPEKFRDKGIDRAKVHKYISSRLRKYKGRKPIQKRARAFSLDENMYDLYEDEEGRLWLGVMSLTPRERTHLLLSSQARFSGNIRIVLRGRKVEIHYTEKEVCPDPKPESQAERVVGIDRGFKEVLTDSDGYVYGEGFGEMLRVESDRLSLKNKRRNKIRSIAKKAEERGDFKKAERIRKNNLGRKKYNRKKWRERKKIQTHIGRALGVFFKAQHPDLIVGEALNFVYRDRKGLPKRVRRYFSGWLKGVIQSMTAMGCLRSGATYAAVNSAYTSQVCSFCGCLGDRRGDIFHCLNGGCGRDVDADYNAARNVLKRYRDPDIGLFTPFKGVKSILEGRFRTVETVQPGPEKLAIWLIANSL